jgi:hypothetical protein
VTSAALLDQLRELLERIGCEQIAIAVRKIGKLLGHRGVDLRVCVTEAEHRRSAGAIEITLAGGIEHITALPAHDARQLPDSKSTHVNVLCRND